MKRSLILIFLIITVFSVGIFSANAQQEISNNELTFSVPDIMENDAEWAADNGYAYNFYESGGRIEFTVSISENDGFSFAGMDETSLEDYASVLEDEFSKEGYVVSNVKVNSCDLSADVGGVNVTVDFASGEKGVFYWFATEKMCYDFEFYVYDVAYAGYVDEVINTVSIVPAGSQISTETPPAIDFGNIGSDNGGVADSPATEPADEVAGKDTTKTVTTHGLSIAIPDFMYEDKNWAERDEIDFIYTTADYLFQVGVDVVENTDSVSYVGAKDKECEEFFEELKKDSGEKFDKYDLVRYETITVNGFEGIKFIIDVSEEGVDYERTLCYFSTKDYCYVVTVLSEGARYTDYIDTVINSVKIDGKPLNRSNSALVYIIGAVLTAGASGLIGFIKKRKAKKQMPLGYPSADGSNNPAYFNPQTDAYGVQYMPEQGYQNQGYSRQSSVQSGNGYIENNGYAPDYNYSNKLDATLSNTDDFSKTEYRMATADMEKKYTDYEEE